VYVYKWGVCVHVECLYVCVYRYVCLCMYVYRGVRVLVLVCLHVYGYAVLTTGQSGKSLKPDS